jgi:nicotinamide mononucleotide transporter
METLLQALRPLFAPAFTLWGAPASWLELLAFVLALAMVVFNIRVNPLGWPLAIVSSLLYFALFWDSKLYGEASLQIVFAVVALWGWWQWLSGTQRDGSALRVRRLTHRALLLCAIAMAAAWPLLGALLARITDSDVPWWDAFPTAGSLIGQWLLGRKYVENWPVWLIVNVVSVGLFAFKGLWLTVLLYAVFAVLSVAGWRAWQRLASGHAA